MSKKRDYIINKMHISPVIADEVVDYCKNIGSDKYAVWIAREINKNQNIDFKDFNKIIDWAHSTCPDIFSLSFKEAEKKCNDWHENLELHSSKEFAKRLQIDEKRILYKTRDGKHFFYILTPAELKYEGKYMGHCVGTNQNYSSRVKKKQAQIVSLRDETNLPHVTIEMILQQDGLLRTGQISGKGNKQPSDKYLNLITEYGLFLIAKKENKDFNYLMSLMSL